MPDYTSQTIPKDTGYLSKVSGGFEAGAQDMMEEMNKAEAELKADPSNPAVLANFQAKLQEYTLFRSAQTSVVKALKDTCAGIIQTYR